MDEKFGEDMQMHFRVKALEERIGMLETALHQAHVKRMERVDKIRTAAFYSGIGAVMLLVWIVWRLI